MRIVSLLPAATETICALGLRSSLVGISHACDHPAGLTGLPRLTRTAIRANAPAMAIDRQVRRALGAGEPLYTVDMDALARLAPDVLVTQGLCAVCAVSGADVAEAARRLPRPPEVVSLEPATLADVLATVRRVGTATGAGAAADALAADLERRIGAVQARTERSLGPRRPRVALLEWLDPPFTPGHWTPELIELAGGRCALGQAGERSRTTSWSEIAAVDPDVIIVACCGQDPATIEVELAAVATRPAWQSLRAVRTGAVTVIDGNDYFNRPGPRLIASLEILAHLLHPAVHPRPRAWEDAVRPWHPAPLVAKAH